MPSRASLAILYTAVLLITAAPLHSQVASTNIRSSVNVCSDRTRVAAFTVSKTAPARGETVTVTLKIRNNCSSGTLNIPWEITGGNRVIASGTQSKVAAGMEFTKRATWTARAGRHEFFGDADPNNTLNESASHRANNLATPLVVNVAGDWSGWNETAKDATVAEIRSWSRNAVVVGGAVSGNKLIIPRGGLRSTYHASGDFSASLRDRMKSRGVPQDVAAPYASTVWNAWKAWSGSWTVTHAAYAKTPNELCHTHVVPPSLNHPFPLSTGYSTGTSKLSVSALRSSLRSALGGSIADQGAESAIDDFAGWLSSRFSTWADAARIRNVLGGGPCVGLVITFTSTLPGSVQGGSAAGVNVIDGDF